MKWKHEDAVGLAANSCTSCEGMGFKENDQPCKCVYRKIFRACMERFTRCVKSSPSSNVRLEMVARAQNSRQIFGRKNEEFIADFTLISQRVLANTPADAFIFRMHFLLGASWQLCSRRLGMNRGNFFHAVYRIEQKLGKAFRETEPYGIYPLDEYFSGTTRDAAEATKASIIPINRPSRGAHVPLRKRAA